MRNRGDGRRVVLHLSLGGRESKYYNPCSNLLTTIVSRQIRNCLSAGGKSGV